MKLTMIPAAWEGKASVNSGNVSRYEVQGLPGNEQATIDSTTTGEGTTWAIRRNWEGAEGEYNSPEETLAALETKLQSGAVS